MRPPSKANLKGDVRGFDVRTGKLLWTFHTIPARGEPGYETWLDGSAETSAQRGRLGGDVGGRRARLRLLARRRRRSPTPTAASGTATISTATASSASTRRPASASGTTSSSITTSGIGTIRRRRSRWISSSTAGRSRPSRRSRSRRSSTRSTASRASPCGRSRSGPCRRPTCRASGLRRRSRSRRSRRRSIGRASSTTTSSTSRRRCAPKAIEGMKAFRMGPIFTPPSLANAADGTSGTLMLPHCDRRRELGRRRVRSRDQRALRRLVHESVRRSRSSRRPTVRHHVTSTAAAPRCRWLQGLAAHQAAVGPDHGDRHEPRRAPLADRERADAEGDRRASRRSRGSTFRRRAARRGPSRS